MPTENARQLKTKFLYRRAKEKVKYSDLSVEKPERATKNHNISSKTNEPDSKYDHTNTTHTNTQRHQNSINNYVNIFWLALNMVIVIDISFEIRPFSSSMYVRWFAYCAFCILFRQTHTHTHVNRLGNWSAAISSRRNRRMLIVCSLLSSIPSNSHCATGRQKLHNWQSASIEKFWLAFAQISSQKWFWKKWNLHDSCDLVHMFGARGTIQWKNPHHSTLIIVIDRSTQRVSKVQHSH